VTACSIEGYTLSQDFCASESDTNYIHKRSARYIRAPRLPRAALIDFKSRTLIRIYGTSPLGLEMDPFSTNESRVIAFLPMDSLFLLTAASWSLSFFLSSAFVSDRPLFRRFFYSLG